MEVYILDSLLRRVEVVDKFESLIWAERMRDVGDFELHVISTLESRNRFIPGVNLACNKSTRIMTVETVQDITDDEGRRTLKITGPSFENILKKRMLAKVVSGVWYPWGDINETPVAILWLMFNEICVEGKLNAGDIISPLLLGDYYYPPDTISNPSEYIYVPPKYRTLYDGIKEVCEQYAIGFRLFRNPYTNTLCFDYYMGSDRTTAQTTLPAVVFSPDLDNLRNTNRLTSSSLYKNVAYVVNATNHEIVYLDDIPTDIDSFDRGVLMIIADDDLDSAGLIQVGKDELAKNRMISALDGQLANATSYVYDVDYFLGDLIEIRDDDGTTSVMQVTEQIFIHDKEGERSFPTLSVNTFIFPGSWIAWDFAQEWDDLGSEHWDELP